jgi:hypothetical protein
MVGTAVAMDGTATATTMDVATGDGGTAIMSGLVATTDLSTWRLAIASAKRLKMLQSLTN